MSASILPRDARLIALLLAANGAEDCEEGVIRMLVEFAHRYTTDILTDALVYAEHGRSATATGAIVPSLDDIRLAVQTRTEGAKMPKEFLLQLATTVNAIPLPPVPEVYGVRLPPAHSRLTAPNFTIVPRSTAPPVEASNGNESEQSGGLFGEEEDEDEDEDDEEMEDVTAGIGADGRNLEGKRKADELDTEEYD